VIKNLDLDTTLIQITARNRRWREQRSEMGGGIRLCFVHAYTLGNSERHDHAERAILASESANLSELSNALRRAILVSRDIHLRNL
jgi:type II secretory pathway component PulM